MKGISRLLQKLLKYFNSRAISAFITPALLLLFSNPDLHLNYSESVIITFGFSLQNWFKLLDAFE